MTPRILAVVNFKGGTGKTTTAAWIAHALAEAELDVFVADADPQGSITMWGSLGEWSIPVAGLAVNNLHTRLLGVAGERDAIVIDTPPLEDHRAIVSSALRLATHVIVPMSPAPIEYVRLNNVREALDDVAALRNDEPDAAVLFTRVRTNTASYTAHREQVERDGWHVIRAHVGLKEQFSQSFPNPITDAASTGYGDAAAELLAPEAAA